METGLARGLDEPGRVWLIGIYYKDELKQFICPKEEKSFIKFIKEKNIKSLVSWTRSDHRALAPIFQNAGLINSLLKEDSLLKQNPDAYEEHIEEIARLICDNLVSETSKVTHKLIKRELAKEQGDISFEGVIYKYCKIKETELQSKGAKRNVLAPHSLPIVKFIDACQRSANCVIWHSYKLHEFYRALFPADDEELEPISGVYAGLFADHLILPNKECAYCNKGEIQNAIIERNKADVNQMVKICEKLYQD